MANDDVPWSPGTSEPFLVADWTVDASANRLWRDGTEVRLEPKVMSVLVYLAGHPGQVVSRDELETKVWTGMVVGYDAVTNTIIKLRRALGDDPRAPRIIETISKQGYRLIADVGPTVGEGPTPDAVAPEKPAPAATAAGPRRRPLALAAGLLALLLAAAFVAFYIFQLSHEGTDAVSSPVQPPSIAVLPFDNPTADASQEYFSNGITEDLITDLSKVSGLLVVARESAFAYKDSAESSGRIGRELGARFLLRGSLRREGQQLRLNVRLIDTRDGRALWAERYDRQLDDIFRIQDELAAEIVSALEVKLAPEDRRRLARNHEASVEAYDRTLAWPRPLRTPHHRGQRGREGPLRAGHRVGPAVCARLCSPGADAHPRRGRRLGDHRAGLHGSGRGAGRASYETGPQGAADLLRPRTDRLLSG